MKIKRNTKISGTILLYFNEIIILQMCKMPKKSSITVKKSNSKKYENYSDEEIVKDKGTYGGNNRIIDSDDSASEVEEKKPKKKDSKDKDSKKSKTKKTKPKKKDLSDSEISSGSDDSEQEEDDFKLSTKELKRFFTSVYENDKVLSTFSGNKFKEFLKMLETKLLNSLKEFETNKHNEDEKPKPRAINIFKNISNQKFVAQTSTANICISFSKFPKTLEDLKATKFHIFGSNPDKYQRKDKFIICMTSIDIKNFINGDSKNTVHNDTKYSFLEGLVQYIVKSIIEEDSDTFNRITDGKYVAVEGSKAILNKLTEVNFSDSEVEDDYVSNLEKDFRQQHKEKEFTKESFFKPFTNVVSSIMNSFSNITLEDKHVKTEEEKLLDVEFDLLYEQKKDTNRTDFGFYNSNVPCVIYKVVDGDTFKLLCTHDIANFDKAKIPNNEHKVLCSKHLEDNVCITGKFMLLHNVRLMFFDAVEAYTLPGSALSLAFTKLTKYMEEHKIKCHINFNGRDPHNRDLGELFINHKNVFYILKTLNLMHKDINGINYHEIVVDYKGKTKSELKKVFEKLCKSDYRSKNELKKTPLVIELAEKYYKILFRCFFEELKKKDIVKLGKEYNDSLTD